MKRDVAGLCIIHHDIFEALYEYDMVPNPVDPYWGMKQITDNEED